MGPYPHEAVLPLITSENPIGTAGFEFIEFAHDTPATLSHLFVQMGFKAVAQHRTKAVTLYRQGAVNYLINAEPDSFAARFAKETRSLCLCNGLASR